jgi:hypothetical protein
MQLTEAATLDRKSGGADLSRRAVEGSAVPRPLLETRSDRDEKYPDKLRTSDYRMGPLAGVRFVCPSSPVTMIPC